MVWKTIESRVPTAFYVHLHIMHNIKFIISDALKRNQKVLMFFATGQTIYNFFNSNALKWATITMKGVTNKITKNPKKVCPTR